MTRRRSFVSRQISASLATVTICACSAFAQTKYSIIHSFAGGSDGAKPMSSLVADRDGNLYGVTYKGGHEDDGIVFQLMLPARVFLDVWLDGSQMCLRDLLQLREGQIVKLDHPVERRAVCTLNGKTGFSGQIVSTGSRRAFMVEEGSPA